MYCIYVSDNDGNIQKVIDNNNNIVMSNDPYTLIEQSKDIKGKYKNLKVSIVDMDSGAIIADVQ